MIQIEVCINTEYFVSDPNTYDFLLVDPCVMDGEYWSAISRVLTDDQQD
jgi:hypothetical protein